MDELGIVVEWVMYNARLKFCIDKYIKYVNCFYIEKIKKIKKINYIFYLKSKKIFDIMKK